MEFLKTIEIDSVSFVFKFKFSSKFARIDLFPVLPKAKRES